MQLKQIVIATNNREKLEEVTMGKGFYITWCGFSIKEIQDARDQSNIIFLCVEDDDEIELKKLALYMRDLCVEDEKIIYIYGNQTGVDIIHTYIPLLYIRKAAYAYKISFSELLSDLTSLVQEGSDNKPTLLFIDDDIEYISKLRLHLEPYFRIYVNHFDLKEIGVMILRANIIMLGAGRPLTLMQFSEIFGILRVKKKQPDFHIYYVTDTKEERSRLTINNAQNDIVFSKDMEMEKIAEYLKSRYYDVRNSQTNRVRI